MCHRVFQNAPCLVEAPPSPCEPRVVCAFFSRVVELASLVPSVSVGCGVSVEGRAAAVGINGAAFVQRSTAKLSLLNMFVGRLFCRAYFAGHDDEMNSGCDLQ